MTVERYHLEGKGRCVEAERAEEAGALPASRAARALRLRSPLFVRTLFPEIGSHRVGKYGMHVRYYDVSDRAVLSLIRKNATGDNVALDVAAAQLCERTKDAFTAAGHRRFVSRVQTIIHNYNAAHAA